MTVRTATIPVLILLNGPPAAGKSTVARRWAQTIDGLHVVDIDTIRSALDIWPAEPERAGLVARARALDVIERHLGASQHVVVPQFLARVDFIEQLAEVAASASAAFVECSLRMHRQAAIDAFLERSDAPTRAEHRDAEVLVDTTDRSTHLGAMFDSLTELVACRPATREVDVCRGDVDETLRRLRAAVPEV